MAAPVLVAYATQFGSTGQIAEAVAAGIRETGVAVDVRRVQDVSAIEAYGAVVLGSAVHRGHLLPEAIEFVRRQRMHLSGVPVAIFCVYISNPASAVREAFLNEFREVVKPVSEGFFTGRFDRRGAALLMPKLLAWLVPPIERRNWGRIRAWAGQVAPLLACSGDR
jgi:menaquinone-dependent protoporphyrinogen oxidase